MSKLCITAKVNPDLDGIACAVGYADFLTLKGVDAQACVFGTPQSEVQYFIKNHGVLLNIFENNIENRWDSFILVDASSMKGMPSVVKAELVQEIVDHRFPSEPEKEFPEAKIQNELVGAAATLITERFIQEGIVPELNSAMLLYAAIYHNTLNFITSNTTERDKKAASFLAEKHGFSESLVAQMFEFASQEILQDLDGAITADAKQFGEFNFYQLVMANMHPQELEERLHKIISKEDLKHPCNWSLLNIVDVNKKLSFLYVPSETGQEVLVRGMNCVFNGSWAVVPAMLRKEIMPHIDK